MLKNHKDKFGKAKARVGFSQIMLYKALNYDKLAREKFELQRKLNQYGINL